MSNQAVISNPRSPSPEVSLASFLPELCALNCIRYNYEIVTGANQDALVFKMHLAK